MKIITKDQILEFGENFFQISIWMGVAYALANPLILPFALHSYLNKEVLSTTVGALTGNKFGELIDKLIKVFQGKNQELDRVIKKVLKNTFPDLEKRLLEYYSESNDDCKSAISSLIINIDFLNFEIGKKTNYKFIENFANSFEYLFVKPFEEWKDKYNKGDLLPENFEKVFVEMFIVIFVEKLHKQLKDEDNKKASIEYTLCLLELSIELNKDNKILLLKSHEILSSIKSDTEILTEYTENVLKLNELLLQLVPSINRHMNDFKAEIINEINKQSQPDLIIPEVNKYKGDSYDFRYKAQFTAFLGREIEMNFLRQFALTNKYNKNFYWWYLTGKGGAGKSRIAYELCIQLKFWDFYAGFLEKEFLDDFRLWYKWIPVRDTFIVIDYANGKNDLIIGILKALESRQNLFDFRVRILLIDRELTKEIKDNLSVEIEVEKSSYTNDLSPLILSDANEDILWGIVKEIHDKKNKTLLYSKEELLMYLSNIDNLKRPLFAFLAGVSLVEGDDIKGWNKKDLLERLIVREEQKIWNINNIEKSVHDKHKTLLAISTLLRGVSSEYVTHLESNNYVWFNPSIQIDNEIYNRIASSSLIRDKMYYLGLEPDILGEFFVLRHFSKMIEKTNNGKNNILTLLSELWRYNPDSLVVMLSMLLQDFDDCTETDLVVYRMILNTKPVNNLNIQSWVMWGLYRNFICNPFLLPKINIDVKEELFIDIHSSVAELNIENVYLWTSTIAVNFTGYFGQKRNSKKLIHYLEIVQSYTLKYPHNQHIIVQYVNALRNGILDGILNDNNEQANKYFNDLEMIIYKFPENEYINYIYILVLCDIIRQLSKGPNFIVVNFEYWNHALNRAWVACNLFPKNESFYVQLNGIICAIAVGYAKVRDYDKANKFRDDSINIKKKFANNYKILYDNYLMNLDLSRHGKNYLKTENQVLVYYESAEQIWRIFRKTRNVALFFAKTNYDFVFMNDIFDGVRLSDLTIQRMKNNLREIEKDYANDWEFIRYTIAGEADFLQ